MNAVFLNKPDGTPTDISICGKCGAPARRKANFDISEKCCTCWECGRELDRAAVSYGHYHPECDRDRRSRIDTARLEKAVLVDDYKGAVALDSDWPSGGWGDGYFESIDVLRDCLEEGDDIEFAYCCTPTYPHLDADQILQSCCEELHEGAAESLDGEEEFYAACDAFNKANAGTVTWNIDYSRKVRV